MFDSAFDMRMADGNAPDLSRLIETTSKADSGDSAASATTRPAISATTSGLEVHAQHYRLQSPASCTTRPPTIVITDVMSLI